MEFRAIIDSPAAGAATVAFELDGQRVEKACRLQKGENTVSETVHVRNPRLWWPNGSGEQALYPVVAEVTMASETDRFEQEIGLRKLELVTEPDAVGETSYFRVNGVPVFAKGANWIPSACFDSRLMDDQVRWELESAAKAHHNAIRVWGGGLYERDSFYRLCDRLGLLVWQDFMFACALYPTSPEFLESVRREVRHQVGRLVHHPCIALWSGNNENEQALGWHARHDKTDILLAAEYDQLYIQTMLPVVAEEYPGRRYWPSSPCNGVRVYGEPNDQTRGDAHYWGVWHGDLPFTNYLEVRPRFCSEFGFQSFASPETMASCTEPDDRNITSPVFEFHQRSGTGNLRILGHIARHFRIPASYEDMLYVSQALQAESIRTACEHWRRIKPHNMGTIIWQLNDIWPVASWSSLEFDGRWKMMHYAARKFFAPLLVSSVVSDGKVEIWGTSDVNAPLSGTLTVRLLDFEGKKLMAEEKAVRLGKLASRRLMALDMKDLCADEESRAARFLDFSLVCGDHASGNQHFFAPFKALKLRKPTIAWKLGSAKGRTRLTLKSDTLAPFVWVRHGAAAGVWSDNGMHLLPRREAKIEFTPRHDTSASEIESALKIHNLYDAGF